MDKICLSIDQKSLYYNIKNDNKLGHTPTVASPIKQGKSINKKLDGIFKLKGIKEFEYKPNLMKEFLKNSKAKVKIIAAYAFKNIYFNNIKINTNKQFCMYIKEEVDSSKVQFGRIKLHYPMTFKYEDEDLSICNKTIMNEISKELNECAFLVEGFDIFDENSINFRVMVVGENQVPYSKVFINEKGVGSKFATFYSGDYDDYDMEIISIRKNISENIGPNEFAEIIELNRKKAIELIEKYLEQKGFSNIKCMRKIYPYSVYDFQYEDDRGNVKYILLHFTSTKQIYFNITHTKLVFLDSFNKYTNLILITDINNSPVINIFNSDQVFSMNKRNKSFFISKE